MTILSLKKPQHGPIFFGEDMGVTTNIVPAHPALLRLAKSMRGFFWVPEKTIMHKDSIDFKNMVPHEQHIFTSNIKRQMLLDSIQSRAPAACFGPVTSAPEMQSCTNWWTAIEDMHNDAYTHVLQSIYPNPEEIAQGVYDIKEIIECAEKIRSFYDIMIAQNALRQAYKDGCSVDYNEHYHKKVLWLLLHEVNALEGLRFYVSFACSWAFAEQDPGRMTGNANIIREICRDENVHLALTQYLIKALPKQDPFFEQCRVSLEPQVRDIFDGVAGQEKAWATYLFKHGSILGLTEKVLHQYVDYLHHKRLSGINMTSPKVNNPMKWTDTYIFSGTTQTALQETEEVSYTNNDVKFDITDETFNGIDL